MRDDIFKRLYDSYRAGMQARMNRYFNILLWCCSLAGPAIALGVYWGLFEGVKYISCIIVFGAVALFAAIHFFLAKANKLGSLTKYIGLVGVELTIVFMSASHMNVTIALFLVPLLCLFYCDRMTYVVGCAIAYAGAVICFGHIFSVLPDRLLYYSNNKFWDALLGFSIQYVIMFFGGLILVTVLRELTERACVGQVDSETEKGDRLIQHATHRAFAQENPNDGINLFIRELGENLNCDRVCIMERDEKNGQFSAEYEWLGKKAEKTEGYYSTDPHMFEEWREDFLKNNLLKVDDIEVFKDANPMLYRELRRKNIRSFMAAPIDRNNTAVGFLAVFNFSHLETEDMTNMLVLAADIVLSLINLRDAFIRTADDAMMDSLESISNIYHTMCKINLEDMTGLTIKAVGVMKTEIVSNVQKFFCDGQGDYVSEIDRKPMDEFMNFDTLEKRMAGKNVISIDFQGVNGDYSRARFIRSLTDENGNLKEVIFAVESIDEEKRRENRLIYLSETDMMTGMRNRGSGEKKIEELVNNGVPGCFILLDADKFKSINDTYGHAVGDEVIIAIGQAMMKGARSGDVVMRLGGDEFAAYLVGVTDKDLLMERRDDIFRAVNKTHIEAMEDRRLEVSLGAAFNLPGDNLDFDELYKRSDSAMYFSKKQHGNCAKVYVDGML